MKKACKKAIFLIVEISNIFNKITSLSKKELNLH